MIVASDSVSKQGHKNKAIGYLIKDLSDMRLSGALKDFRNKVKFLYRPSVLTSIDKTIQDGCTVLIVTASPSFAISDCVSDLPVIVLGTEFEKEEEAKHEGGRRGRPGRPGRRDEEDEEDEEDEVG